MCGQSSSQNIMLLNGHDTVLEIENPAYGEVQKQQQGTQQASP